MIEFRDVSLVRTGTSIVRNVNLSIAEGEFVAIRGPNGAGKTTLLSLLTGFLLPSSGKVFVMGRQVTPRSSVRLRREIGYCIQSATVDPGVPVSVKEAVAVGTVGRLGPFRRPGREERALIRGVLERVGLSAIARRPVGLLSGGERQKVNIGRALAQRPKVLLLDEPLAHLDAAARRSILDLIDSIYATEKLTVVMVSHVEDDLPRSSRRIVEMSDGRIP